MRTCGPTSRRRCTIRRCRAPRLARMLDEAGVRLDVSVDWQEVALIVCEAYLHVAPKRLAARLDGD